MDKRQPYGNFSCPQCQAQYKLIRVPAQGGSESPPLKCKVCSQEFASTEDGNILKYFLVGARRQQRIRQHDIPISPVLTHNRQTETV